MIHNLAETLRHAAVWLLRVRHRRGYGVHSPFAYNMIRRVFFETQPFYAYAPLQHTVGRRRNRWQTRADRLMLRLANEVQPRQILELGTAEGLSALCLAMAVKECPVLTLDDAGKLADARLFASCGNVSFRVGGLQQELLSCLPSLEPLDFVHFNTRCPERALWEELLPKANGKTVFAIEGIHASPAMKTWWLDIVADSRIGVTFDLYDLGLVFFDLKKIKQHYIVNF